MPISRSNKPRIAVTIGDPSGIGPEVTLKALASPGIIGLADFIIIGNTYIIDRLRHDMGLKLTGRMVNIDNVPEKEFIYGVSRPAFGRAAVQYIDKAVDLIKENRADALVTAPINKSSIVSAGIKKFEGHTEYLADKAGSGNVAMMFVGDRIKITLVTRHIALSEVSKRLSEDKILSAIDVTYKYMKKYFRIRYPRIAVAGLNPHAGEGGIFGSEEEEIIMPAIRRASSRIKGITGPISPDVIFNAAINGKYDAVISMYHDQALIPFKLLYFDSGVNLSVGLPFIRTSPDHGTAFDIAGKGVADASSMTAAIRLACRLSGKV